MTSTTAEHGLTYYKRVEKGRTTALYKTYDDVLLDGGSKPGSHLMEVFVANDEFVAVDEARKAHFGEEYDI